MSCVGNLNDDRRQTIATGKHLPSLSSEMGNVLLKEIPRLMNLAIFFKNPKRSLEMWHLNSLARAMQAVGAQL